MAEPQKPMAFLETLDETQKKFADEIIEKSKKKGMDPNLGLALVYRESKFDPNVVGGVGEIGLGQIRPSTGKLMGYTEKDLKIPSRNIDATLQYLNQNLIKFTFTINQCQAQAWINTKLFRLRNKFFSVGFS